MPHRVRKRGSGWVIVKLLPGGRSRTVGRSSTRRKAAASARIRDEADRGPKRRRQRRGR